MKEVTLAHPSMPRAAPAPEAAPPQFLEELRQANLVLNEDWENLDQ